MPIGSGTPHAYRLVDAAHDADVFAAARTAGFDAALVPRERRLTGVGVTLRDGGVNFDELEKDLVRQALERSGGNQTRAGELLGMTRDQVHYRIEKYGLKNAPAELAR